MQKSHWQWLLALGLGLVIVLVVRLNNQPPTTELQLTDRPSQMLPTDIGQKPTGVKVADIDPATLADLPTVDQLQAMPTPAPEALILFEGSEPTLSKSSASIGSEVQFINNSPNPVKISFGSGSTMTVESGSTAGTTLLSEGNETIIIETDSDKYLLQLTVTTK